MRQALLYRALVQVGTEAWEAYSPDRLRQDPQEERSQALRVGRYQGDIEDLQGREQLQEALMVQGAV